MDSIIEENGNSSNADERHSLSRTSHQTTNSSLNTSSVASSNVSTQNSSPMASASSANQQQLSTTTNVLQYHLPSASHTLQVQSVIQAANQSSVIQTTATNVQSVGIQKDSVLYVTKPGTTVIHTAPGNAVQIKNEPITQQLETNSEESLSEEDSPQGRRELTRRPSYHKIFTEISGPDMSDNSIPAEEQTRKREIRLQKNREAARECRRKKKEYIKCLENRVAVLENQNKALIEELKSLKELYCQTKND